MAKFRYTGEPTLDANGAEVAVPMFTGELVKVEETFEIDESTERGAFLANKARSQPWLKEVKRGRPPKQVEALDGGPDEG